MGYFFKIFPQMLGKSKILSYLYYVIKDKIYENNERKIS